MLELVALACVLSMDNIRLAGGLALLERSKRQYWRLAVVIALVEGILPLVGATVASASAVDMARLAVIGPLVLVVAIALSMTGTLMNRRVNTSWMLYALPVLFGLDNLAAGAAVRLSGTSAIGPTLFVGAVSGVLSFAAMVAVDRCVTPLRAWWAGSLQHAR